jgi:hypothetical protein
MLGAWRGVVHQGRIRHRLRGCRIPLWEVVKKGEGEEDMVKRVDTLILCMRVIDGVGNGRSVMAAESGEKQSVDVVFVWHGPVSEITCGMKTSSQQLQSSAYFATIRGRK